MSSRWSKNQHVGDCKTCLCRISHQKCRPDLQSEDDSNATSGELCDAQMSSQLLATLKTMRDDESLCDVKLCVGTSSTKFPAHKVLLAAASPYFSCKLTAESGLAPNLTKLFRIRMLHMFYFHSVLFEMTRKMFSCGLKETQDGIVNFHDMLPEVLLSVVNFIYTGKIQIDEAIVDGLLDAADLLQLPSLRNLCLWWLTNNLSPQSCLGVYVLALLRSHLDLAETAKMYAIEHFREVSEGEEFIQISPEYLSVFLESPYLGCDNDGQLLKGLLEWTNHDIENRKSFLKSFLEKINLEEIAPQVLIEVIQHPIMAGDSSFEKIIRDSLTNVLSRKFDSAVDPDHQYSHPNHYRCYYQQDVLFAIGGESQGQSLSNVECFMMGYDGWKCSVPVPSPSNTESTEMAIIPTMKQCRYYPAVASLQYSIYVIGGQDCGFPLNIVEKYDVLRNQWESLSPLPICVHGCGAALVNSRLYLVGGRSSKEHEKRVWIYDDKADFWHETTPMRNHRVHLAVAGFNGELYAIGGIGGAKDADDNFLSSVEKFDPLTNTWSFLAPMHEERAFHSAAAVDCHIYALGGCNGKIWLRTVERYDTMCGQWSKVCNMSIPRSSFGVAVTAGRIYCCGGYDGVHFLNTVEKYNPRTDRWHCVHAMQIDRYGLAVATLSIPLKSHVAANDYS